MKEMKQLYSRRAYLLKKVCSTKSFLRGSYVVLARPCTNPNCQKCKEGTKHPTPYHSISKNGKTQLTYVPKNGQQELKQMVENYKKLSAWIEELSDINLQLLLQKSRRKKA